MPRPANRCRVLSLSERNRVGFMIKSIRLSAILSRRLKHGMSGLLRPDLGLRRYFR